MSFAFVFPGQGSQSLGMMSAYEGLPCVRDTFQEASDILKQDLWHMVMSGTNDQVNETTNTQPLMLTADIAIWRAWLALGGVVPSLFAGHSLGEYAALVAAESLEFSDAVRLVRIRAQLMQEAVPLGLGSMAAILGMEYDVLESVCRAAAQGQVVSPANLNAPGQIVIAGHSEAVDRACQLALSQGAKRALVLPVSGPFHSFLMTPAAMSMQGVLEQTKLLTPKGFVLHNIDASARSDPFEIKKALVKQIDHPVRWIETIQSFAKLSVSMVFESGPGKVLTALTKRIDKRLGAISLHSAEAVSAALELLQVNNKANQ